MKKRRKHYTPKEKVASPTPGEADLRLPELPAGAIDPEKFVIQST